MGEITISTQEYKDLIYKSVTLEIFADYVKQEKYSISREDCARYLGFELPTQEEA